LILDLPWLLNLREEYPFDLLFDQDHPKAIAMMGEQACSTEDGVRYQVIQRWPFN